MQRIQRCGLATFFHSTVADDINCKIASGWKSNDHECGWFGISCVDNATLTEISLPSNRSGIGNKMGKLTHLEALVILLTSIMACGSRSCCQRNTKILLILLAFHSSQTLTDLGANDFTGKIPSEMGDLSKLKSLRLEGNSFSGVMPSEICLLTDDILKEIIADSDSNDPFSHVTCYLDTCCSECY